MSRSLKKSYYFKKNLLKEKKYRIFNKSLRILPSYKDKYFFVYNGQLWIKINITEDMIGYKFGEFIFTRKRIKHKSKKIDRKKINNKKKK